jgi:hypothetical protein
MICGVTPHGLPSDLYPGSGAVLELIEECKL